MEIQTQLFRFKIIGIIFCINTFLLSSCTSNPKDNSFDIASMQERQKAIELAYEYEQFVNKIWQDLNTISDSLTNLQLNQEAYTPPTRRTKMASIEKNLEQLEEKLKNIEHDQKYNNIDKQKILQLRDAILQKDKIIQDLTNQVNMLKGKNASLTNQLEDANQSLEEQNYQLKVQLAEQRRLRNEITFQTASNYESMGDVLRKAVLAFGGHKGNGNLKDVKQAQLKILEECLECYNKAYKLVPTESLKNKIILTRRGIIEYRNSKSVEGLIF